MENKYITVAYKLYVMQDGQKTLVEEATVEHPFQFISGLGTTLERFETEITALKKGDKFEFVIPTAEAYGEYMPEGVRTVSKDMFTIDGVFDEERIFPGAVIPLQDNEGHHFYATVSEVTNDTVTVDLNHPHAGKDLTFEGEVVESRTATNEEIQEMVKMMSGEGCGVCMEAAKIAAVLAIVLLGTHYWTGKHQVPEDKTWQSIYVPAGQRAELMLADGTKVWLNSRSTLTFPGSFKGNIRNVKLDGEGYFAVTKNVEQPFIVETNKCNVKVLGTEFNVMAYAADSVWETSLLEGAVEILVPGSNNSGMRLEPNMMASLKGNRLVKGRIKEVDYFLWREGLLCFNDISVRDMIEKLKLYYGVDIVVNNTRILKNRYTGKFRTKDGVEHVLKVLRLNNKFTYTKDDETNVITIN